jgi:nicotinamide riboside kinase
MKRIVILGPESTGKSFLSEQLAAHYNSTWVREYAREYLETNGAHYQYEDLYEIAKGQVDSEEGVVNRYQSFITSQEPLPGDRLTIFNTPTLAGESPFFNYTDLYTIKIWSEISFNKCDNRILTQIARRTYDAYLLCNTDLPWVPDPLREYPDLQSRQKIYNYYLDVMVNQEVPWIDISGNYEERFLKALEAVDRLIC